MDIVPLIGNKSDVLMTIKKCILNSKRLDFSIQKIKESKSVLSNSILIIFLTIAICLYLRKNFKTNHNKETVDSLKNSYNDIKEKNKNLKLTKTESDNDKNNKVPIIHPVAKFKQFNKLSIDKTENQKFAKAYPVPVKFPGQSLPIMLIPGRNPVTYIHLAKPNIRTKKNNNTCHFQQPLKNIESDFSLNSLSKHSPILPGCSSTPKKQISNKHLNIKKSLKKEKKPFDTQNVLDGLDDLDLEITEQDYDTSLLKNTETRITHEKNDSPEINKNVQLKILNNETFSGGHEYNKVTKDLIEKVALNVIGNDKDNKAKNSKEIIFPVVYTPNSSIVENSTKKPNLKNHNISTLQLNGVNSNIDFKDLKNINYPNHNNISIINKSMFPNYMASPIVGNSIWNIANQPDQHKYTEYS